jgi:hypothetical protein
MVLDKVATMSVADPLGLLARLSVDARQFIADRTSNATARALDIDVGAVVVSAWRDYTALMTAARETAAQPDTAQVVDLAQHTITAVYRPTIEVLLDGALVVRLVFELTLAVTIATLCATVSNGSIVSVQCGRTDLTATILVSDMEILRRTRTVKLPVILPFARHGIQLVKPRPGPATGTLYHSGQYPVIE